jgi:hypothetical protein
MMAQEVRCRLIHADLTLIEEGEAREKRREKKRQKTRRRN